MLRLIIVFALLAWVARAEVPIQLRSGVSYPDGAEDVFMAKSGRLLLTRAEGEGYFSRWDTRDGYELAPLVRPDGTSFQFTGKPTLSTDRTKLLLPDANAVRVVELASMEWIGNYTFENANAILWDESANRFIVSRNQGRRNHLYTIDASSGEITEVARLRGASRDTEAPTFDQLRFTPSGKLLGSKSSPAEFVLVDPTTWLAVRSFKPDFLGWGESLNPLPDGNLLRVAVTGYATSDYKLTFDKIDPENFEVVASTSLSIGNDINLKSSAQVFRNYDAVGNRTLVQTDRGFVWLELDHFELGDKVWGSEMREPFKKAYPGAWDADRELIYFFADRQLVALDPASRSVKRRFGTMPMEGAVRALHGIDAFMIGDHRMVSVEDDRLSVSEMPTRRNFIRLSPDGKTAVSTDLPTGAVHLEDSSSGKRQSRIYGYGLQQLASPRDKYAYERRSDPARQVLFSAGGDRMAIVKDLVAGVYDLNNGDVPLLSLVCPPHTNGRTVFKEAALSSTGDTILFHTYEMPTSISSFSHGLMGYDVASGKRVFYKPLPEELEILGRTGEAEAVALNRLQGDLQYFDIRSGDLRRSVPVTLGTQTADTNPTPQWKTSLSADGKFLLLFDDRVAQVIDVASGKAVRPLLTLEEPAGQLVVLREGTLLVSPNRGYVFYNLRNGKRLGELTLFEADAEWVFHRSDGRFDATIEAQERMYFQKGDLVVPLASLYEATFTSGLFSDVLQGVELVAPDLTLVADTPRVSIALATETTRGLFVEDDSSDIPSRSEKVRLQLKASSDSSLIEEIQLFHNGKRVQSTQRGLYVADDIPKGAERIEEIDILLLPGENILKAVAINQLRTESRPAEILVSYNPPNDGNLGGVRLHLVVAGVNLYENPKYNLNYAVADAQAFEAAMQETNRGLFTAIQSTVMLDAEVSRASVLATLQKISVEAGPRDVFVFYYAGHGVMSEGVDSEFYLVPPDVTQLYGDNGMLAQRGVSASTLRDMAKAIRAQKQIFILDACQSAGALATVAMRGAPEERAIALLARSTGTHWLAATGSAQMAAEFAELGHGAFTHALLEGLKGSADRGQDGQVTVQELNSFLQERVPELTRQYRGAPQYPASFGYGQDFPIGVVSQTN